MALSKRTNTDTHTCNYVTKSKKSKVRSYHKYQKKVNQRKGKDAMLRANSVFLSIAEANSLFVHDGSSDEMCLLDLILEAKLSGQEHIKIDRLLYERMKTKITQ